MNHERVWICDVDGVVADFCGPLLRSLSTNFSLKDIKEWNWFSMLPPSERESAFKMLETPDFWKEQPVIDGAKAGIEKIKKAGFTVVWCTSPWEKCREWGFQRTEWLKRNFKTNPKQIIIATDKRLVRGAAYIDDKLANVDDWMSVAGNEAKHGYVFDAPYNQEEEGKHRRMMGWSDIDRVIEEVISGG